MSYHKVHITYSMGARLLRVVSTAQASEREATAQTRHALWPAMRSELHWINALHPLGSKLASQGDGCMACPGSGRGALRLQLVPGHLSHYSRWALAVNLWSGKFEKMLSSAQPA